MMLLVSAIVFVLALVLQALFAGYETGFVSANPIRVRHLAEEENSPKAKCLLRHLDHPDQMLTTLLIGTNLMVVICTLVVSREVENLSSDGYARFIDDIVSSVIVAPLMLVFAEIIPKSIFRIHPTRLSLAFLPVIRFTYTLMAPVAAPVAWLTRGLLKLFGGEGQHMNVLMSSLEDVRVLVDEGVDHGTIKREEQEMIHSVIDLQTTTVKEIMVPRIAIQGVPETATRDELETLFVNSGRTRLPVYQDTVDRIVGVINAYSLLIDPEPQREDIKRFVKEVLHVPDTMKVGDLFQLMKHTKQHLAVVTDEYGGTDGLVTIEDILEEIFGEIQDEYDHEERRIHKVGPNAYAVDARVPLEEASEAIGAEIKDDEVETVGGWLMHVAGHIPVQGEVIEHERFRVTVLVGTPSCISRVRIDIVPEPNPGAEQTEHKD